MLYFPIRLNDKISGLYDYANSGYNAPTQQVKDACADLSTKAGAQRTKLKNILSGNVVELNRLIREKAVL